MALKGPPQPLSYIVHNITSACCRQNFLTFLALKGPLPLSQFTIMSVSAACGNFLALKGPPQPLSYIVHNITSACCRQNFLTFLALKGPLPLSQFTITLVPAKGRRILALKGPPQPLSYIVHNIISACRRQKFFGFKGPFSLSLSSQ